MGRRTSSVEGCDGYWKLVAMSEFLKPEKETINNSWLEKNNPAIAITNELSNSQGTKSSNRKGLRILDEYLKNTIKIIREKNFDL